MTAGQRQEIEILAEICFVKEENFRAYQMMNTPQDYKERMEAAKAYAVAQAEALEAKSKLFDAIHFRVKLMV